MRNLKATQPKKTNYFYLGLLIVGFISGVVVTSLIASFNAKYTLAYQSPIVIQSPILISPRGTGIAVKYASPSATLATPQPTVQPTVSPDLQGQPRVYPNKPQTSIWNTLKHADIVYKVWGLESTYGKNDGCRTKGLVNGFGFMQQDDHDPWMCFQNLEDVATRVDSWFDSQLAVKTLSQALCYYQSGVASNDCGYYQKYLALK